ncbi:TetR family transcriptional regulator [Microbacterium esteraromaticum]|uniref:TetR family transcriptional regulator n=1 Tax=Microbacterium esteraromaticum TaxID=57043 RepID=A0A7D8AI26_9MICO|nr:TetR family transcriptional regulator C-terminal domain-containing protein [Microbacterium esteraromaticum]QMU96525.1 TetR family transcriptional regulator [Microbacterium esteraromaticum]
MSTPATRTRTRKSPQQRSAEIHDAALAVAREEGLSALTLRAVAGRAGVASGLVAHYVESMDELVARTFRELVGAELDEVRAEVSSVSPAPARLARMIETVLGSGHSHITLIWVDAWSLGRGSAALAEAIEEQMAAWQSFIAGVIGEGGDAGYFATEDPPAVGWQILAMLDGIAAHALTRRTDAAAFAERLAQACETLVGARPGSIVAELGGKRAEFGAKQAELGATRA